VTTTLAADRVFPDSIVTSYRGFSIEIQPAGAYRFHSLLDALREEVLQIAAISRGWEQAEEMDHFRSKFKIGPMYETNALALIRKDGILKGIAGSVNNWHTATGSIVHLCSVGLMREAQARGFIPCLLRLLWQLSLRDERLQANYRLGRVYVTAITQSSYLMSMLDRLFRIFPSPSRDLPDEGEIAIARAVVQRFDAHLILEEDSFVLRNECDFFYRREPSSRQQTWNEYCHRVLRAAEGDVFLAIGRALPERLVPFLSGVQQNYPELTATLDRVANMSS
jgi:hypothetical protein